jgi:anti-anti-sigma factor
MDEVRGPVGEMLRVRVAHVPGAPVVMLSGEIDLSNAAELAAALAPEHGRVVVDLDDVSFMECRGIAILVAARNRLVSDGGSLHLRSPQHQIRRVFDVLGLESWIVDAAHQSDAVARTTA